MQAIFQSLIWTIKSPFLKPHFQAGLDSLTLEIKIKVRFSDSGSIASQSCAERHYWGQRAARVNNTPIYRTKGSYGFLKEGPSADIGLNTGSRSFRYWKLSKIEPKT